MSEVTEEEAPTEEAVTDEIDIHPDDPDDEWSTGPVRSGLRLRAPTAALLALVVLAGGFWAGAIAEKHHSGSSSSSALSALASRFAAARGASGSGAAGASGLAGAGAGGAAGAAGSATSGIVTGVVGNILYVTDSSGALVKVEVGPSVPITRTAKSSLAGLQTGDTVVVQGSKGTGGEVTATSVRATGQGVTSTFGGGGGGGFFGNSGSGTSTGG